MDVVIRNLSSRPLYVPLHNGQNVRLAPGASSFSVHEVQVKGNATVEKLLKQRMISVYAKTEDLDARAEGLESAKAEAGDAGTPDDSETRPRTRKRTETGS